MLNYDFNKFVKATFPIANVLLAGFVKAFLAIGVSTKSMMKVHDKAKKCLFSHTC